MSHPQTPPHPVPAAEPDTVVDRSAAPPVRVAAAGASDVGRKRTANQDSFLTAALTKSVKVAQTNLPRSAFPFTEQAAYLIVVADGMGGHAGGEEASSTAVSFVEDYALHSLKWFFGSHGDEATCYKTELRRALERADALVRARAAENPQLRGMGTTVTLGLIVEAQLFIAHVGDSRAYLLRSGELFRLTKDHTLTEELVRRGMLSEAEAARHPMRHVLSNAVGGSTPGVQVDVTPVGVRAGDALLFCSDGLTEMVKDDAIQAVLASAAAPQAAADELVRLANEAGGRDNITAVVARLHPIG